MFYVKKVKQTINLNIGLGFQKKISLCVAVHKVQYPFHFPTAMNYIFA